MRKDWVSWANLAWRRLRGDHINAYKYLKGIHQKDEARLFSVVLTDGTIGNGHKLKPRKFHLNINKHWSRMSREFAKTPSLGIVRTYLDTIPCKLLWETPFLSVDWTTSPDVPFNHNSSMILWFFRVLSLQFSSLNVDLLIFGN